MQLLSQLVAAIGEENVAEKIREKQEKYFYLLTEEAAGRIICRENGIHVEKNKKLLTSLDQLESGQRVTNVFRIAGFSEPRNFKKSDRQGVLLTINLGYAGGQCTLLIWNSDAKALLASKLNVNDCVRVTDAVVKNLNPLELNLDLLAKIELLEETQAKDTNAEGADITKIPLRNITFLPIDKITASECIHTRGVLANVGEIKTFQTKDREGKLRRGVIKSETTQIPLVCWGEYAELLTSEANGKELVIVDAKAKINKLSNAIEVHTGSNTRIVLNEIPQLEIANKKISELKEGENTTIYVTLEELKEVKTINLCEKCFTSIKGENCQCGGKAKHTVVAEAVLADESGKLTCTFFDTRALQLLEMKSIAPDVAQIVTQLKQTQLKNRKLTLKITTKQNNYLNALTANCKQIV